MVEQIIGEIRVGPDLSAIEGADHPLNPVP
jgi:hypothetical protein